MATDDLRVSFKKKDGGPSGDGDSIFDDPKYKIEAAGLISGIEGDDGSILQMADGSILSTKTIVLTILHRWNKKKGKFYRVKSGSLYMKRSSRENEDEETFVREEEEEYN